MGMSIGCRSWVSSTADPRFVQPEVRPEMDAQGSEKVVFVPALIVFAKPTFEVPAR